MPDERRTPWTVAGAETLDEAKQLCYNWAMQRNLAGYVTDTEIKNSQYGFENMVYQVAPWFERERMRKEAEEKGKTDE